MKFDLKRILKGSSIYLYFALSVIWLEIIFHIRFFEKMDAEIIHAMLFSVCLAMIPAIICSVVPKRISKILAIVFSVFIFLLFAVQAVYYQVFKTFLVLFSVGAGTGQVLEFWRDILAAIVDQWLTILLYLMPLVFLCVIGRKILDFGTFKLPRTIIAAISTIVLYIVLLATLRVYGTDLYSAYDLYNNEFIPEFSMRRLGLMTTMRLDFKGLTSDSEGDELVLDIITTTTTTQPPTTTPTTTTTVIEESSSTDEQEEEIEIILDYVLDTSPNMLDIDFVKLGAEAKDKDVATLHNYFANTAPSNKNEYTGMFEGYNLIKITAEGFNHLALDEQLTPTLYKLANSGFVFTNFYNPLWWYSTLDGEYVACTGLLPRSDRWAFNYTGQNSTSLPFSMGNALTSIGYSTYAYHNHTFSYYYRNKSHPNMGYIYKGVGNGLEVRKTWPESDLEMIELSINDYIDKVPFHAYYMTVSGHLNYTFGGNAMAKKNKALVEHLDASEQVKAYMACHIELDKALAKLIEELDTAGLLETTVIVLSGDHYPYGLDEGGYYDELAGHTVDRNFEVYESSLILWSGSMKEPVIVDKACSSLDIMPTLCNLFGLEYDSRLFMGRDILSDSEPLVVFRNRSFITDKVMYNANTGKVTYLTDEELPEKYLSNMKSVVKNMFTVSKAILDTDYYSYIEEYTTYGMDKALYPEKYDFPVDLVKGKDY